MDSEKMKNILIGFVIFVIIIKSGILKIFDDGKVRGGGFEVARIEGWEMKKETDADDMFTVTFLYPPLDHLTEDDIDPYNPPSYEAMISITGGKQTSPMWMEDEIGEIIGQLMQSGYILLQRGQIKIDEEIFYWIMYESATAKGDDPMIMSMYATPDNGKLYKLEYLASPKVFNKYKPLFDRCVNEAKLKKGMF